jgi:excisionase family DNA binding protein
MHDVKIGRAVLVIPNAPEFVTPEDEERRMPNEKPLTTSQVADYCHVNYVTVLKWIKDGALKAYRVPSGHYRILRRDFREFLEHWGMPVDEAFFGETRRDREAMPNEKPLTAGQVADYCHVNPRTVCRWIEDGVLKAYRIPGGHRRILRLDFREFLEYQGMPIDEAFFGEAGRDREAMPSEKPLTTGQVATCCHVAIETVLKWIKEGDLKAYRVPGGHRRILRLDFKEFLEYQGMPIDEAFFGEAGRDREAMPSEKALTTSQVAGYCHVSRMTVLKWIKEGDLKAYRIPSGRYRIPKSDLREFLEHREMPVDEAFFGEAGHSPEK